MVAQKQAQEILTCAKCKKEDVTAEELKRNGHICDDCHLKITQIGLPLDDYSLQPDEMTIEQFATTAKVTPRAVQKWLTAKLINYELLNRRSPKNQIVSEIRVFKAADVHEFLENRKKGKPSYKVDKVMIEEPNALTQNQNSAFSPDAAFNFLKELATQMQPPKTSVLTQLSGKIFISLDELAQYSGIAKARLAPAIKEAVSKDILQHFTGERGKSVYKCEQLDLIIENLPATPKQLPPKKKNNL